ncbi:MAG TPA: hypothetical protein VK610_08000 [Rhodothermales bacterium]|nr:hypothetical protein [Rhodothermales bacterium]
MRVGLLIPAAAVLLALQGCDGGEPTDERRPLTLASVIAPVTAAEVTAVRDDWDDRDTGARSVQVEDEGTQTWGSVQMRYTVFSHEVAGIRHFGAVLVPASLTASDRVPVLVYTHGGYTGPGGFDFPAEAVATRLPGEPLRSRLVHVIPSYRSERIQVAGQTYTSGGSASIGDYDVDDTMALLSVVIDRIPQADGSRVAVVGESRGALVALEMGARDPRVDLVVDAYGPTDFRTPYLEGTVGEAEFLAAVRAGVAAPNDPANLLTRALLPLDAITVEADGSLTITEDGYRRMRLTLARTSPRSYVVDLPTTQVHHGTADATASIADSRALRDAFIAAGRPPGSGTFSYYEYEGGGHDVTTLPGYFARVADELTRVLNP